MKIHISQTTREKLLGFPYTVQERGEIEVKVRVEGGIGRVVGWLVGWLVGLPLHCAGEGLDRGQGTYRRWEGGTGRVVDRSVGWFGVWLVAKLVGWLMDRSVDRLICYSEDGWIG